jgi:hypothetical protein
MDAARGRTCAVRDLTLDERLPWPCGFEIDETRAADWQRASRDMRAAPM